MATRHVHLDPVGGIAGDMFVAAMLDAFSQHKDACWQDIEAAGLLQHVNIEYRAGSTQGLAAQTFSVTLREAPAKRTGRYADLRRWLEKSALSNPIRQRALSILHGMATAEACVHGVSIDDVHFHEIADWDSLVDVVAAASLIEHSEVDSWSCAALPLGSGLVKTEHGMLPVPAPATLNLLQGFPVWDDGDAGERVTPTGAAVLKHLFKGENGDLMPVDFRPSGIVVAVGCGAGQRKLQQRPNMLRVVVTHKDSRHADVVDSVRDDILQITCDIDDMSPEELAVSLEYVRACDGVVDVSYQLGYGKKGRTTFHVVVLCQPACERGVSNCLFHETTTLGMRISTINRRILKRTAHVCTDEFGQARVKVAERSGLSTAKVESDDLAMQPGLQARRLRAGKIKSTFDA